LIELPISIDVACYSADILFLQEYVLKKSIATLIKALTEENPPEDEDDTLLAKVNIYLACVQLQKDLSVINLLIPCNCC
jgi:hypothetical protein